MIETQETPKIVCDSREGRYGDTILYCLCDEVIGIQLKSGPVVITRLSTRVFIPCPEGIMVGCPKCRREWVYEEKELVLAHG